MSGGSVVQVVAPYRGCEWRDMMSSEDTATLVCNVTTARGAFEARRGTELLANSGGGLRRKYRLHGVSYGSADSFIISVDTTDAETAIALLDNTSSVLEPPSTLANQHNPSTVSFVDFWLPNYNADGTNAQATLVCTKSGIAAVMTERRTVVTSGLGSYVTSRNQDAAYWDVIPNADICVEFDGRIWYAGFPPGYTVPMTSEIDSYNEAFDPFVDATRKSMTFRSSVVVYSDMADPLSIKAGAFRWTENNDPITGMASFQERLVVFTANDIYALSGGASGTAYTALEKVVSGTGCISHQSITEAEGVLYFLSDDGVYSFDGNAATEITTPVRGLFTGDSPVDHIPQPDFKSIIEGRLWPWRVNIGAASLSCGIHVRSERQVWFSLPLIGEEQETYMLTLVVNYEFGNGITFNFTQDRDGLNTGLFFDGTYLAEGNSSSLYLTNSNNEMLKYGHDGFDGFSLGPPESQGAPVQLLYLSNRIGKGDYRRWQFRPVRFIVQGNYYSEVDDDYPTAFIMGQNAEYTDYPLYLHPDARAANADGDPSGIYAWDNSVMGWAQFVPGAGVPNVNTRFQSPDWFSSEVNVSLSARWCRIGFVDDGTSTPRGPKTILQMSAEWQNAGRRD